MGVRLLWFTIVATSLAYGTHLFFGSIVSASVQNDIRTIHVADAFHDGEHDLSGMVMAPSPCYDLTVRTEDVDAKTIALIFETWQQPYRTCGADDPTPRAFTASVFAPANIDFRAFLDSKPVRLDVVMKPNTPVQ